MGIQYHEYHVSIKDEIGSILGGRITEGVVIEVRVAGTKAEASTGGLATLFADRHGNTSLTNPISGSDFTNYDQAKFFTTSGAVDITVRDYGDPTADDHGNRFGRFSTLFGVTPRSPDKVIILDRNQNPRVVKIPFLATGTDSTDTPNTWDNAEASCVITAGSTTTIKLCKGFVATDAFLEVTAVDAGETLSMGLLSSETGGDADGYLKAISLATAGQVTADVTRTLGSNADFFVSTTRGAYLATFTAGADTSAATIGTYQVKNHYSDVTAAETLSFTGSAAIDTAAGYAYLVGYVMPMVDTV